MFDRIRLKALIKTYSGQGPRYTSYPTAVEFSPTVNGGPWKNHLLAEKRAGIFCRQAASLYVHIPFCRSLCYFCACHKVIVKDRAIVAPYLNALMKELELYRSFLPDETVLEQIHWGGGSPSYLSISEAKAIFQRIDTLFQIERSDSDISIEVDPRTADDEKLLAYRELGFQRLSLGVQDFSTQVQEAVNRVQPYEMTARTYAAGRKAGFMSINIDLIYGLPEQTTESFAQTLKQVLALRPDRIALYGYAHVTWLKKVQKSFERYHLPGPEERIDLFLLGLEVLQEAGYVHIGMDHFALPEDSLAIALRDGTLHRSFMGYTTHRGRKLFAVGASAISCFPDIIVQNHRDLPEYTKAVDAAELPVERGIVKSKDDQLRAAIIDNLFCQAALDIKQVEMNWGVDFWQLFASIVPQLETMASNGILQLSESRIELSPIGRLFTRNVAMLFDAYLPAHLVGQKKVFSATV